MSLIYRTPKVRRGQRPSSREENAFRRKAIRALISGHEGVIRTTLPGGTTMWPVAHIAINAGQTGSLTNHAHKDEWDGGYDNFGFTGPD